MHEQATSNNTTTDAVAANNNKKFEPLNEPETYNAHKHTALTKKKQKFHFETNRKQKVGKKITPFRYLHRCAHAQSTVFLWHPTNVDDDGDDNGDT